MSVLACDREGCENVMCDRYSYQHGYICNECFEELVNSGPETNIADFMQTVKKSNQQEITTARKIFNIVFPFSRY